MNTETSNSAQRPLIPEATLANSTDQMSRIDLHLDGTTTEIKGEISSAATMGRKINPLL